jgi:hypothetical protein
MILIGIDPGVQNGYAVMRDGVFTCLDTRSFWELIDALTPLEFMAESKVVYIENPNVNRPVFVKKGANAKGYLRIAQNVGSNKRDAQLIIEFCQSKKIPCVTVAPLRGAYHKPDAKTFYNLTGCKGKTSQHARDAAMLIYGIKH